MEFACACELLGKGEIAPLAKHGVNQHSKDSTGGDNITSSKRGTDTEYTLRRLKSGMLLNYKIRIRTLTLS